MGKKKSAHNGEHISDMSRYAPTSWAKAQTSSADDGPYEYETSSGQLCLLKNISMTDIFRMGLMDTLDFFIAGLSTNDKNAPQPTEEEQSSDFTKKLLKNFDKMETTINKVLLVGVVAPPLAPVPDEPTAVRKEGVIYVDKLPFEDRVELFNEILDTEGLSDFREESKSDMGHVPAEQVVQLPADATVGD